jgi:hypothetical protein
VVSMYVCMYVHAWGCVVCVCVYVCMCICIDVRAGVLCTYVYICVSMYSTNHRPNCERL